MSDEDVAGTRPPETEGRPGGGEVGELRRAVDGKVVGEPLVVRHAVGAARDDAELLVAEPHDREVRLETTARRQPGRVDDAPDGRVDLAHRYSLQRVERAGTGDVEDRERRQVEDPCAVAHGECSR